MHRRVELVSGIAAAAVGAPVLVAIGFWLGRGPSAVADSFLLAILITLVGVGVGAYQHSRYGASEGRWMVYAGTGLLFVAVAIAVVSFGLLLLPAALLALIASVSASLEDHSHHAA